MKIKGKQCKLAVVYQQKKESIIVIQKPTVNRFLVCLKCNMGLLSNINISVNNRLCESMKQ
ncbi:CLUMA_CG007683, isoform A [Clunio marinus]|uniref:CLUMA_CG007683, isoform A n=1 Tax=Clunio marinus TaxID=568069 RepID=A0A1J1I1K2_9DIPT|nr:CLUMA_CG007683, isoform A [Clunio marinus]